MHMILERLEALPVGSFQYKLLLVTGLGWLFDSMDTGLIAFVLPILAKEWSLTPGQVGWIGSIGLIGMALGAVLAGTLADRIGRKKVFTITVLLYSLSTGMCALAWSYESLLFFRFLVGFGLGGELPVAATLMSEYAPAHLRGRFIVLLESFWGLGWLAAACISYLVIPVFGWQAAFVIGTLPALYVFLIRLHMPESIRYPGTALERPGISYGLLRPGSGWNPAPWMTSPMMLSSCRRKKRWGFLYSGRSSTVCVH